MAAYRTLNFEVNLVRDSNIELGPASGGGLKPHIINGGRVEENGVRAKALRTSKRRCARS